MGVPYAIAPRNRPITSNILAQYAITPEMAHHALRKSCSLRYYVTKNMSLRDNAGKKTYYTIKPGYNRPRMEERGTKKKLVANRKLCLARETFFIK